MPDVRPLVDSYGRRITTLRISLTEHCNFRCVYCMPPEGVQFLDKTGYLTGEEIARFARIVGARGVTRVRLTGGEPLLRKDIVEIVARLKQIDTVCERSLTTNGSLLADLAAPLAEAGLDRVNISLDSLDRRRFDAITRVSRYDDVWRGIHAALDVGWPVKLNVVVLKAMTRSEIQRFAALAVEHDIDVRFLEFMPLCGTAWQDDLVYPIADVREAVREVYRLEEMPRRDRPAQTFRIAGGRGRVGFIASLSEPFCGTCSRMRLTADGNIRPCLFSNYEVRVGHLLKNGADDDDVATAVSRAVQNKPWGSQFMDRPFADGETTDRLAAPAPLIRNIGG